jgi:hypothetical protein
MARGTVAVWGQSVLFNGITRAAYQDLSTTVTMRVLKLCDPSRKVPCINVMKPSFSADLSCPKQVFWSRIVRGLHFVVLVKRCHVPGNVRRD